MQSVAGALILVSWIAWYSESASWRPMRLVEARVLTLASSQICRATAGLTRENELTRNWDKRRRLGVLEHRHQPAQLDAVGVRLDLLAARPAAASSSAV